MSNKKGAARLNPDERCEQILRVAAIHFAREGYDAVSVQAIAEEADVTRALVYHYYPGKDALLEAVLQREAEALLAATELAPDLSPGENLARSLGAYLDHFWASSGRLRDLYAPRAATAALVGELSARNHLVQVGRIMTCLELDDTPTARLAIVAWLGFVVEAARQSANSTHVPKHELIRLCTKALCAVTGAHIDMPAEMTPSPLHQKLEQG